MCNDCSKQPVEWFPATLRRYNLRRSMGPGLLATFLADVASNFFFMDPKYDLWFTQDQGVRLALFLIEGVCISVLAGTLQRARRRAEASAAVARDLEHTLAEVSEAERRRL